MIGTDHLTEDQFGAILESKLTREDEAVAWAHISGCAECAAVFSELTDQAEPKTFFGQYHLISLLGRGGMGEVYLARGSSGPPVVIKRILDTLLDNEDMLSAFLDETRIAARLRHPNIVRIDELGEVDGEWFVRMEYVEGTSLFELMRRTTQVHARISLEAALFIGSSIARALTYAHQAVDAEGRLLGLVHRDVTPQNIVLSRNGAVKLIDFGVARAEQSLLRTSPGMIKGKLAYMSLEQAQGHAIDGRADLFALGVCLWEMITGRRLFRADTEAETLQRVFAGQVSPPSLYRPDVPPEVDALIFKAVARTASDRFATAGDFAEAIETVIERYGLTKGREASGGLVRTHVPELGHLAGLAEDEEPTQHFSESSEVTRADSPKSRKVPAFRGPTARTLRLDEPDEVLESSSELITLPPEETPLIGRAAELADLHQRIGGHRLVTLLGPGGVGKSRLASAVMRQQSTRFRGRVWSADIATARSLKDVCQRIADALGVGLPPVASPQEGITMLLASRRECLLVIDQAEVLPRQVREALAEWLRLAKGASFLVCSQVALGLPEEQTYEVTPLPLDGDGEVNSDAMQLFFERARARNPAFSNSRTAREAVRALVRRLEGIPLAIELAAAQLADAPLEALAQMGVRPQGPFAAIDEAFEATWSRLTDEERSALAQCTMFTAGFTGAAAIEVVQWPDRRPQDHAEHVLRVLHGLRAKSLLRVWFTGKSGQPRYGMYEAIRSRIAHRLLPEQQLARRRHAGYFLKLGELLGPSAERGGSVLDVMTLERENLTRAFEYWLEQGASGPSFALRVVMALDALFAVRGPYGTQLAMLDAVLEKLQTPAERAPALETRGRVLLSRGRLDEAAADLQTVLAEPTDDGAEGRALAYLASVRKQAGNLSTAKLLYERALVLLERVGDVRMQGRVVANMATLAQEEGSAHANALFAKALRLHKEADDRRFEGTTLSSFAALQQVNGEWSAAETSLTKAIGLLKEVSNRRSEGIAVTNLADLERDRGAKDLAIVWYRRAIAIHREVGNRRFEGICLLNHALLMLEACSLTEATELLDEALGLFQLSGDKRHSALTLAARGALRARQNDPRAADDFETAKALLVPSDLSFVTALDVYRAQLQFSRADRLEKDDPDEAAGWREAAGARIDAVVAKGADGERSLAERFEHVRMALRVLRSWLLKALDPSDEGKRNKDQ